MNDYSFRLSMLILRFIIPLEIRFEVCYVFLFYILSLFIHIRSLYFPITREIVNYTLKVKKKKTKKKHKIKEKEWMFINLYSFRSKIVANIARSQMISNVKHSTTYAFKFFIKRLTREHKTTIPTVSFIWRFYNSIGLYWLAAALLLPQNKSK